MLDKEGTHGVQCISRTFLYYGCGIDPCILPPLNEIYFKQSNPTASTMPKNDMLMGYFNTNPEDIIQYHVSDMILKIVSYAVFLVPLPKHKSAQLSSTILDGNTKTK